MYKEKPEWIKKRIRAADSITATGMLINRGKLNTVCQSAACPNLWDCFSRKIATFMIMGNICSRNCRFCAVEHGAPGGLDASEPRRLAGAVAELGLRHVVITSVTRDDLPDGGAAHFAACMEAIRALLPGIVIEVLTPDFQGRLSSLQVVMRAKPDVYNHNLETVPRLYPQVRAQANYSRSLELLRQVKNTYDPAVLTKSGIMLGLGETYREVAAVLADLRSVQCDIVTIGQYLQPSPAHYDLVEYIHPGQFEKYRLMGMGMGFKHVEAAPFVRSSFNAHILSSLPFFKGKNH